MSMRRSRLLGAAAIFLCLGMMSRNAAAQVPESMPVEMFRDIQSCVRQQFGDTLGGSRGAFSFISHLKETPHNLRLMGRVNSLLQKVPGFRKNLEGFRTLTPKQRDFFLMQINDAQMHPDNIRYLEEIIRDTITKMEKSGDLDEQRGMARPLTALEFLGGHLEHQAMLVNQILYSPLEHVGEEPTQETIKYALQIAKDLGISPEDDFEGRLREYRRADLIPLIHRGRVERHLGAAAVPVPAPDVQTTLRQERILMLKRLPADALTGLSLLFGMASVYAAFHDHFDFAAWLIYAAAIADAGDGWMARRRGVANNVGLFRDTVVDAVVFGGFSSILMWRAVLDPFISSEKPLVALIAVAALFVFAFRGLWRLARFIDMTLRQKPLRESAEPQTKDLFFFGMPIPAGASVLAAFVLSMDRLPATWNASAGALEIGILSGIATAGLTATATLMDLPYPALNRLLSFVKKHFMLSGIAVALAVFAALHSLPAIAMAGVVVTAMAAIAMLTKLPYPALGWFYKSIVNYPLRSAVVVVAALAAYLMLHSIYLLGLAGLSAYMLGPMVRYFYQRTLRRPIRRMLRHPLESKSETPSQTPRPG